MPAYPNKSVSLDGNRAAPAEFYADVTPNDNVDLPDGICRGIWIVTTAGNISVLDGRGTTHTFPVVLGFNNLGGITRVRSAGTTAVGIKAIY